MRAANGDHAQRRVCIQVWESTKFGLIRLIETNGPKRKRPEAKTMQDAMNTLMLVCASLASLAFGVLAAYGICRAAFAIFRIHARSVAANVAQVKIHAESQVPNAS
jgi:hypothetical protein